MDACGVCCLVDRNGHFFGRLFIGLHLRRRHNDSGRTGLFDRQRAGGDVHVDVVLAAGLDGVADRAAARCRVGHAGIDAFIRVSIGNCHIIGGNGLCLLVADRHSNGCCGKRIIIVICRNGDVHGYAARISAGGQNAAVQRAAVCLAADRITDISRCAIQCDVFCQIDGVSASHNGRCACDGGRVIRFSNRHGHVHIGLGVVVRRVRRREVRGECMVSHCTDIGCRVSPRPGARSIGSRILIGQRHIRQCLPVNGSQTGGGIRNWISLFDGDVHIFCRLCVGLCLSRRHSDNRASGL